MGYGGVGQAQNTVPPGSANTKRAVDALSSKISQFVDTHADGTVGELRSFLQDQQIKTEAAATAAERAFEKGWVEQKRDLIDARVRDAQQALHEEEGAEEKALDARIRTAVAKASTDHEELLRQQRVECLVERFDIEPYSDFSAK